MFFVEPEPRHEERRQAFRCPVQGERQLGRLRIKATYVPVEVLDESALGFAVQAQQALDCQVGDKVLLEIASAWFETRVANRTVVERETEDAAAPVAARTRLGLARLRELDAEQVEPAEEPLFSWLRVRSMLAPLVPLGRSARGTIAMIVAILVVGVVVVSLLDRSEPLADALHAEAARSSSGQMVTADLPQTVEAPPAGPRPAKHTPPRKRKAPEPAARPTAAAPSKPVDEERAPAETPPAAAERAPVPDRVARLAHPQFVLRPEVESKLTLNDEQRSKLAQLAREYEMLLAAKAAAGETELEADEEAIAAFGRRGWEVLSDEQRRILSELHASEVRTGDERPAEPQAPDGATTQEGAAPGQPAAPPPASN